MIEYQIQDLDGVGSGLVQILSGLVLNYVKHYRRKLTTCIGKKGADELCSNWKADQAPLFSQLR